MERLIPDVVPAAVLAMMATLREPEAVRLGAAARDDACRLHGLLFGTVRLLLLAMLAALLFAALLTNSAAAQAVPVPDPVPQPLAPPASPPIASPRAPLPSPDPPPASAEPSPSPSPLAGQCSLLLHDGTYLIGAFVETKAMPFEAIFGNIEIPIGSIQVVDMSVVVNGVKTHRVQFINGDMLTGNVGRVEPMKFATPYGTLTVPMEDVVRVRCGAAASQLAQLPGRDLPSDSPPDATPGDTPAAPADQPPGPIRPPRSVPVPDDEVE